MRFFFLFGFLAYYGDFGLRQLANFPVVEIVFFLMMIWGVLFEPARFKVASSPIKMLYTFVLVIFFSWIVICDLYNEISAPNVLRDILKYISLFSPLLLNTFSYTHRKSFYLLAGAL